MADDLDMSRILLHILALLALVSLLWTVPALGQTLRGPAHMHVHMGVHVDQGQTLALQAGR